MLKGSWGTAKEIAHVGAHASVEKVQSYEEAFTQIQVRSSRPCSSTCAACTLHTPRTRCISTACACTLQIAAQAATGISDVDELVTTFINAEVREYQ